MAPAIVVEPERLDFGGRRVGASPERFFTISSVGTEALTVRSIALPDGAFFLEDPGSFDLLPDESIDIPVTFSPISIEDDGLVTIVSDDAEHPDSYVTLSGHLLVPQLAIEPSPLMFPATPEGCEPQIPVTLRNVGTAPLQVDEVLLVGDTVFDWNDNQVTLPLNIEPGDTSKIKVRFAPGTIEAPYAATMWVGSNDPAGPDSVPMTGEGEGLGPVVQRWMQPLIQDPAPVDLMFTIDRSCSMNDDASNLASNFAAFATSSMGDDVQVMVVTRDNGCHNGPLMSTATPNLPQEFTAAVFGPGNEYGYTEAGLTLASRALAATGPGACNRGFLRNDAKRHVVMVSDERDQSDADWSFYVNAMQNIDPHIKLHGVVGKWPCGAGASGYLEAIEATGGIELSLCTPDWGEQMQVLADELQLQGGPRRTFGLDWDPDVSSIVVTVDGVVVTTWSYDAAANEVTFDADAVPGPGTEIHISYDVPAC